MRLSRVLTALLVLVAAAATGGLARPLPAQPSGQDAGGADPSVPAVSTEGTDEPAVIEADELVYDEPLDLVIARGSVEIVQAGRILRADQITYNRKTRMVTATGNVVLVEPTGEVLFADYAELDDSLRDGFVEGVAVLFPDDSRFIATSGRRRAGRVTEVDRGVYSPCDLCPDDPRRAPLWQLRAARITHDAERRDVIYRDAYLDMFGVPVFYTPYLSHPDPTVEQRTGFLTPTFGTTSDLGPFIYNYFYWGIAPDRDATFTLGTTTERGLLLGAEYRQRFARGEITIDTSVNQSDRKEDVPGGTTLIEDDNRGHLFLDGRYEFNEFWRAEADISLVSDDTYLDVFEISDDDELTSRVAVERFEYLDYFGVEGYSFRDLRSGAIEQPLVLPLVTYSHVGDPDAIAGGQWYLNGELLSLQRGSDGTDRRVETQGVDTRRAFVEGGWRREDYLPFGLVLGSRASLQGTTWWTEDQVDEDDPTATRGTTLAARLFPEVNTTLRYPWVRQDGALQTLIEPVGGFRAAADLTAGEDDIPNNDSVSPEFDEINLLADSRLPGKDRVEDGIAVTYGLRTGVFADDGRSGTLFLGQRLRLSGEDVFPEGSGLENDLSDVVGRLTLAPASYLDIDWRFRIDYEDMDFRRQEISARVGPSWLRASATYTAIDGIEDDGVDDRKELKVGATAAIGDYWRVSSSLNRDIDAEENREARFGVTYLDECFLFTAELEREFTEDRDDEGGYSLFMRVAFRNLADVPLELTGGSLFE